MITEISKIEDVVKLFYLVKSVESETEFMLYNSNERIVSDNACEQFYKAILNKSVISLAYDEKDYFVGYIIGRVRIEPKKSHIISIAIGVLQYYNNKGIGTKLIEEMLVFLTTKTNIKRIELAVHEDNVAAIALYKKFGFEIEGIMKKAVLKRGAFINEYLMSKLL